MLIDGDFRFWRTATGSHVQFHGGGRLWDWDAIIQAVGGDYAFTPSWGVESYTTIATGCALLSFSSFGHALCGPEVGAHFSIGVLSLIKHDAFLMSAAEVRSFLLRLAFSPALLKRKEARRDG